MLLLLRAFIPLFRLVSQDFRINVFYLQICEYLTTSIHRHLVLKSEKKNPVHLISPVDLTFSRF